MPNSIPASFAIDVTPPWASRTWCRRCLLQRLVDVVVVIANVVSLSLLFNVVVHLKKQSVHYCVSLKASPTFTSFNTTGPTLSTPAATPLGMSKS